MLLQIRAIAYPWKTIEHYDTRTDISSPDPAQAVHIMRMFLTEIFSGTWNE